MNTTQLKKLSRKLAGELLFDDGATLLYATDASAYREKPLAVAIPKTVDDLKTLIRFASENNTSLIPRTAGTSLAGQVVGSGIVVDVSRHFTRIIEVNEEEQWVRVEPGVIRDELNMFLKPTGYFFAPETSTANRAMIGGMIGNNSCGSNSIVYGSVRDHLISVKALLSDGAEVEFRPLDKESFFQKFESDNTLEAQLYRGIYKILSQKETRDEILKEYPKKEIERRNTGYALDILMDAQPFGTSDKLFNFCKLIAGSEGTLAFVTEAKLFINKLPPPYKYVVCAHFNSIEEALRANVVALKHDPSASELIDHYILESARENIEQKKNLFFIKGNPAAILVIEVAEETEEKAKSVAEAIVGALQNQNLGYHHPVLQGRDIARVWSMRKAGLGLLYNVPGDDKPAPVIEDTAVTAADLPGYISEFNAILKKHNLYSVHYGHAGAGELHLRPILNLKTEEGNRLFRTIAEEIASLVKKYRGSLSGEHGDGRLRGEFIRFMIGAKNYETLLQVKRLFDPRQAFNPGKIVDAPPMDKSLRYEPAEAVREFKTQLDFRASKGILRAAEQCNGSGDCRKTELTGGIMCPSYMATRNEKDTTRARANILREMLTHSRKGNPFNHKEIYDVLDLCISCKGCKKECPSNVDMAKLKAEFLYQYYKSNRRPLRSKMIAALPKFSRLGSAFPMLFNFMVRNELTSSLIKGAAGISQSRNVPQLYKTTLTRWFEKNRARLQETARKAGGKGRIFLFCDEFTNYNYNDALVGIKAVELLSALGYEIEIPRHEISGRTYISKGFLKEAKALAVENVTRLSGIVSEKTPLVGLEPSAALTFRDEYIDLVGDDLKDSARELAANTSLVDEFIAAEIDKGAITEEDFTDNPALIMLHGHCHQKTLSSLSATRKILSLPKNYTVEVIPSGCCGMAGSFGYEKEHYEISMKIGELVLFPAIRRAASEAIVVSSGTSCRHQIKDGTAKQAFHPVETLWDALRQKRRS